MPLPFIPWKQGLSSQPFTICLKGNLTAPSFPTLFMVISQFPCHSRSCSTGLSQLPPSFPTLLIGNLSSFLSEGSPFLRATWEICNPEEEKRRLKNQEASSGSYCIPTTTQSHFPPARERPFFEVVVAVAVGLVTEVAIAQFITNSAMTRFCIASLY